MRASLIATLSLSLLLVAACGSGEPSPPPEENVFSDQTDALDKARDVGKTLEDAQQQRTRQLEDPDL